MKLLYEEELPGMFLSASWVNRIRVSKETIV